MLGARELERAIWRVTRSSGPKEGLADANFSADLTLAALANLGEKICSDSGISLAKHAKYAKGKSIAAARGRGRRLDQHGRYLYRAINPLLPSGSGSLRLF